MFRYMRLVEVSYVDACLYHFVLSPGCLADPQVEDYRSRADDQDSVNDLLHHKRMKLTRTSEQNSQASSAGFD